jgi:hypothetical protein
MWRTLLILSVLLTSCSAHACVVTVRNDTAVEMFFNGNERVVIIKPGEARKLEASSLAIIELGAIALAYDREEIRTGLCQPGASQLEVRAQPDGTLEVFSSGALIRVLKPTQEHDLT